MESFENLQLRETVGILLDGITKVYSSLFFLCSYSTFNFFPCILQEI